MFQTKPTLLLLMLKRQCKECFLKIFKLNLSFSLLRRSEGVSSFHVSFRSNLHNIKTSRQNSVSGRQVLVRLAGGAGRAPGHQPPAHLRALAAPRPGWLAGWRPRPGVGQPQVAAVAGAGPGLGAHRAPAGGQPRPRPPQVMRLQSGQTIALQATSTICQSNDLFILNKNLPYSIH